MARLRLCRASFAQRVACAVHRLFAHRACTAPVPSGARLLDGGRCKEAVSVIHGVMNVGYAACYVRTCAPATQYHSSSSLTPQRCCAPVPSPETRTTPSRRTLKTSRRVRAYQRTRRTSGVRWRGASSRQSTHRTSALPTRAPRTRPAAHAPPFHHAHRAVPHARIAGVQPFQLRGARRGLPEHS